MIDRARLLADSQAEATRLVESLRERLTAEPPLRQRLEAEHQAATKVGRTGGTFAEWLEERLEQVAASWVLACVFVRFLEDNDLVEVSRLSGPGDRLTRARDEETVYFRKFPSHSVREYLEGVFRTTATLPGAEHLLGEGRNTLWTLGPTGDGARDLLEMWRRRDPDTGVLVHDFTDPARDTRFLGDLYQDLSAFARKRYALLQTPEFVEEFILDRTLEPALAEFGLEHTTLIDPACGSGHFLLGAFERLLRRWQKKEPATNPAALAQKALAAVAGVDLNPFAVAIARFRLLVAALAACGITRLKAAPAFEVGLAAGDSLLHGPRPDDLGRSGNLPLPGLDPNEHYYAVEDPEAVRRILSRRYAVVVANPPYITPVDKGSNELYRSRFGSCSGKYSLAVPFTERCFDLVRWNSHSLHEHEPAGFVGMITANSFMKREFGKKLIEEFFPRWDLTQVVDTSGAYIPGHGTPTVILLARGRQPRGVDSTVRVVRGLRGEPSVPRNPAHGLVWTEIIELAGRAEAEGDFVSVDATRRARLHRHPWNLAGGGVEEVQEILREVGPRDLAGIAESIGIVSFTLEDAAFVLPAHAAQRRGLLGEHTTELIVGEAVRDWVIKACDLVVFPYTNAKVPIANDADDPRLRYLWRARTSLARNIMFGGKTKIEAGLSWFEWGRFTTAKLTTPYAIVLAERSSQNQFCLDESGRVSNQTTYVVKLPKEASPSDYRHLLGLLNSSIAQFWFRQTCHPKTAWRITTEQWDECLQFSAGGIGSLPVRENLQPLEWLVRQLLELSAERDRLVRGHSVNPIGNRTSETAVIALESRLIFLQEELDWTVYLLYGFPVTGAVHGNLQAALEVRPGERAFEIQLARSHVTGDVQASWFDRQSLAPVLEVPSHWPTAYQDVVRRRLQLISSDKAIGLLERPANKRRWLFDRWSEVERRGQQSWLLDRLEDPRYWPAPPAPRSAAQLADLARLDPEFLQVAEVYRGRPDFDVTALVSELVEAESVPAQAACRYKAAGLRKHAEWRKTWDLQRREDAIDARTELPEDDPNRLTKPEADEEKRRAVGKIPVPPKYDSSDFQSHVFWRHRGKLDVPKERFVSLPGAERDSDPTPVVLWAGYDHLQQAEAIAGLYVERKEQDAWPKDRLLPLLVALHELVPWLKQWHNAFDPDSGMGLGEYFGGFVDGEARVHGLTLANLAAWVPAKRARKAVRKAASAKRPAAKAAPDDGGASGVEAPADRAPATKKKPRRRKRTSDPRMAT